MFLDVFTDLFSFVVAVLVVIDLSVNYNSGAGRSVEHKEPNPRNKENSFLCPAAYLNEGDGRTVFKYGLLRVVRVSISLRCNLR